MMELAKWYKIILFGKKCIIIFCWKENIPIETILYCFYSWFSLIIRFGVTVVTHVITTLTWKKANNIKYILLSQYTTSKMKVEHVICMRELYFFFTRFIKQTLNWGILYIVYACGWYYHTIWHYRYICNDTHIELIGNINHSSLTYTF